MTWFKVDDGFADHPKVIALREKKNWRGALALWTLAGSWAARHLTDGRIPRGTVKNLGSTDGEAASLVAVGLWEVDELDESSRPKVYRFHDWNERNPTRESVQAKRETTKERVAAFRSRNASVTALHGEAVTALHAQVVTHPVTHAPSRPVPTRPVVLQQPPQPVSDFGQYRERFWRVFVKWFSEKRGGQFPARLKHTDPAALAVWNQANADGIDPVEYAHALCDLYWQQDWPNDPDHHPTIGNFYDQLDRLIPVVRTEWAEHIQREAAAE